MSIARGRPRRPARAGPNPLVLAFLVGLASLGALTGCATGTPSDPGSATGGPGDGGATGGPGGDGSAPPTSTNLRITLDETGQGGELPTVTLTCDPVGGTHPDAAAACAALQSAGVASAFDPPAPDQMCTEQYGGPQRATVVGTLNGTDVDAEFSRTNGCEISRWDAVAAVLGSSGGGV